MNVAVHDVNESFVLWW